MGYVILVLLQKEVKNSGSIVHVVLENYNFKDIINSEMLLIIL